MAQTVKLISADELRAMKSEEYAVIDIRGEYSYSFGHIDGAVLVSSKLSDGELSAQNIREKSSLFAETAA